MIDMPDNTPRAPTARDRENAAGQVRATHSPEDVEADLVRLSVSRLVEGRPSDVGEILLDVQESNATVAERAISWATVQGYERLIPGLQQMLTGEPPQSGFAAVINKRYSLLVLATWPWCPTETARNGEG